MTQTNSIHDGIPEPGEQLKVVPLWHEDAVVLVVRGEIDGLTAPDLQEAVIESLAQQPETLIIDLSDVDFLSSAGLAVLAYARQTGTGHTQVRVVASGIAARAITVSGLDQILDIRATRADALTSEQRNVAS